MKRQTGARVVSALCYARQRRAIAGEVTRDWTARELGYYRVAGDEQPGVGFVLCSVGAVGECLTQAVASSHRCSQAKKLCQCGR